MQRAFFTILLLLAIFVGFQMGYSLPPFIQAGVLGQRKEKGVESKIDEAMKRHYEELLRSE